MIRRNFFVREDQDKYIRAQEGNDSEIIRRYIDIGIAHDKAQDLNVSHSQSKHGGR